MDPKELRGLYEAYSEVYAPQEVDEEILDEAEGSYGATPKAYSAASKTKMTAKRKPFLKKMQSRTNPANRTDPYGSPRKGLTADDRERARAGSKHGVGTRQDHDYPSEGPGGVTKNPKKLRKQKALGEIGEGFDIFDVVLEFLQTEGFAETLEEAEWMMANLLGKEDIDIIVEASCSCEDEDEKEMKKGKKSKKSEEDEEDDDEDDDDLKEASYSTKAARAGKDIGKPGKAFAKIAKSAAKRYGSEERGKKVAGAILAKLRAKKG
jgi:hypothetical protein